MIKNNVKKLKTITSDEFLALEFNTLKDEKRDVKKLVNSIKKSGWNFPVYLWADHNFVIDGAGRKKAVEELLKQGEEINEIPVVEIHAETLEEAKAKVLEVSSQFGDITRESFLEFTKDLEIDFDTFEIDGMTADAFIESDEKDNEVPPIPEEPKSKLGDLYEIGKHRVLCGDSTKMEDVERLMDGKKADMVFTDPPYNVAVNDESEESLKARNRRTDGLKVANDKMSDESFRTFLSDVFVNMFANMKKGAVAYVCYADSEAVNFISTFKESGFHFGQNVIWNKQQFVMTRKDYHYKHEPILYGWKEGEAHPWYTDRKQTSVWNFDRPFKSQLHPTTKPLELVTYAVTNSSKGDDIVQDLFLGSGSTLIASEKTGRICYGMELDPKYVDVIVQRYVDYVENPKVIKNGVDETTLWQKTQKNQ